MKSETIAVKAARSMKWSVLTEVVSRSVTPLTFIALARILAPQDFGVVAVAQIAISFCSLFWDAGLEKALIQTKEPLDKAANVVFWTNIILGLVIYCILFTISPLLSVFFNSPASGPVLQVLGLQIIIGSLSTVQQALFLRDLNFKQLFWAKLATAAIPAVVSIPLAFIGYGVWALVASSLTASMMNLIILWVRSPWRPNYSFDAAIARKMSNFGIWIVIDSFAGWFISQGDALVIGRFLGVGNLGFYRTGRNVIDLLFGITMNPIYPILYPAFSALHADKEALRSFLYKANRIIMSLTFPMGLGLMCIASPLVMVVLGEKWHGTEIVLSVLGLQTALGWLVAANPEIYRAMGRPDVQTKIAFLTIPIYMLVYFMAAPYGLTVFLFARLGLTLVGIPVHVFMAVKILNLSYYYLWEMGKKIMLSAMFMVLTIYGIKLMLEMSHCIRPPIVDLLVFTLSGAVTYLGALYLLDKQFVLQACNMVKKAYNA